MKKIIFNNYDLSENSKESYKEYLIYNKMIENTPEAIAKIDYKSQDYYDYTNRECDLNFDTEVKNLNIQTKNPILAIADLGRWNGRVNGYKIMGNKLNEILYIFYSCDYFSLWYDTKTRQVCGEGSHHDGTNYIKFREFKDNTSDRNIDRVKEAIYAQSDDAPKLIYQYTQSIGHYVKKIYGW
jgi:hypothetical protein